MTTAPVDELAQALRGTEQLVAAVRDEQWTRPTPCTDWKVRDLVNHLVGGNRCSPASSAGGSRRLSQTFRGCRGSTILATIR
jgi:uncharacterized protein (TIGR03086 family)